MLCSRDRDRDHDLEPDRDRDGEPDPDRNLDLDPDDAKHPRAGFAVTSDAARGALLPRHAGTTLQVLGSSRAMGCAPTCSRSLDAERGSCDSSP
jgi:hypothetical protein